MQKYQLHRERIKKTCEIFFHLFVTNDQDRPVRTKAVLHKVKILEVVNVWLAGEDFFSMLKFAVFRCAGKRDYITYVGHAGYKLHHALKTQPEP